jgi:hypothetical protein
LNSQNNRHPGNPKITKTLSTRYKKKQENSKKGGRERTLHRRPNRLNLQEKKFKAKAAHSENEAAVAKHPPEEPR